MKIIVFALMMLFTPVLVQAVPLKVVSVGAPAINCVFNQPCTVSVSDIVSDIPMSAGGTGRLQSRTYKGMPGSPANRNDARPEKWVSIVPCSACRRNNRSLATSGHAASAASRLGGQARAASWLSSRSYTLRSSTAGVRCGTAIAWGPCTRARTASKVGSVAASNNNINAASTSLAEVLAA